MLGKAPKADKKDLDVHLDPLRNVISENFIEIKEEDDIESFLSGGQVSFLTNEIKSLDDFELICFLVVR